MDPEDLVTRLKDLADRLEEADTDGEFWTIYDQLEAIIRELLTRIRQMEEY